MSAGGERQTIPVAMWGMLALMTLIWGVNWPILKIVMTEMSPLRFRSWCMAIGACALFLLTWYGGGRIAVPRALWGRLVLIALANSAGWNILAVYGIPMMDSGRAAIIAYTFPIWATLFSVFLGEALTRRKLTGLVLGFAAIVLLLGAEIQAIGRAPLGALLLLASAFTWATGTILTKRWPLPIASSASAAWQHSIALVPVFTGAVLFESGPWAFWTLSPGPMWGLLFNAFVVFVFCLWTWLRIVAAVPPSVASLSTLAIPIVGVASGMLVLGEKPAWTDYAALLLVVGAIATVLVPARGDARDGGARA